MILYIYFTVSLIFIVFNLFRIESCIFDLDISRSRETKALMKRKLNRSLVDIGLSIIWSLLMYRLIQSLISSIKYLKK